jgi:uroporphyrinogen-III synthase
MTVIVTRPHSEAQRWVQQMQALGLEAAALPLIEVSAVPDTHLLLQAWEQIESYVGVMFVSGYAAKHFFACKPTQSTAFQAHSRIATRAWATGPGTATALLQAGVEPERLDAPAHDASQFDSESLWQRVAAQVGVGDRVLIVRGGDASGALQAGPGVGRDWFAAHVARVGARTELVQAYQRSAPQFSAQQLALAREAATDGSVWLFSSSEALANLLLCLPEQSLARARAVATHARIAAAVRNAGFAVVCESRPTLADVVASIESMG